MLWVLAQNWKLNSSFEMGCIIVLLKPLNGVLLKFSCTFTNHILFRGSETS